MSRMSISTPCPPPTYTSSRPPRRSSIFSTNDNDTTCNIDYTATIPQPSALSSTSLQPRRRSTFQRRPERQAPVHIFEDVAEDEEPVVGPRPRPFGGSTLLGKPAQKMPVRRVPSCLQSQEEKTVPGKPAKKRESILPNALFYESTADEQPLREPAQTTEESTNENLKRYPRRRTIFLPEDTTVMSIHPGAENTTRLNDTFQFSPLRPSSRPVASQQINSRPAPRMSQPKNPGHECEAKLGSRRPLAAMPPKRVPLGQVVNKAANLPECDVNGKNGGKENIAPYAVSITADKPQPTKAVAPNTQDSIRSRLAQPTAASNGRRSIVPRASVPISDVQRGTVAPSTTSIQNRLASRCERSVAARPSLAVSKPERRAVHFVRNSNDLSGSPPVSSSDEKRKPKRSSPFGTSSRISKLSHYPVLAEHVAQPQLYEDNWLNHQEVALTELINGIFVKAQPSRYTCWKGVKSLRQRMLDIYHQPKVTTLHKRLQASLLYGAFCRPRETATNTSPAYDIGLRKRFLSFWLDNYTEEALRTAAEVVIGRQLACNTEAAGRGDLDVAADLLDPMKGRRALTGFLETFLVSVDDVAEGDEAVTGSTADLRWRKMMLRSLMLIWLLDQAKIQDAIPGCLFQAQSTKKSTPIMLMTLGTMLIPSVGDILRVLRNFEYDVSHVQDPLDEVEYRIQNLAVDLRDGILLTRLVELLIFPENRYTPKMSPDATVTIQLPDMTVLESDLYLETGRPHPRTLSQHLKMPCLGRAQKLFNVQIGLSALATHGGAASQIVQEFTPEDIVDGHRERTLSLLWSLVSSHVLSVLVDWQELRTDIARNGHRVPSSGPVPNHHEREELLRAWAESYSARRGIKVRNLTTAFADGLVYTYILDAFSDFFTAESILKRSAAPRDAVADRLRSLGCSTAFVKHLTASQGQIPTETTTLSNLAFLASRLLPLARNHHAAVVVQRAWRKRYERVTVHNRIMLMRLAHACASIVQTQQKLIHAATVIQTAWRGVVSRRQKQMDDMVAVFQDHARGWLVRRRLALTITNSVMCGW